MKRRQFATLAGMLCATAPVVSAKPGSWQGMTPLSTNEEALLEDARTLVWKGSLDGTVSKQHIKQELLQPVRVLSRTGAKKFTFLNVLGQKVSISQGKHGLCLFIA